MGNLPVNDIPAKVLFDTCRGIVTADVLMQGLSRGAIAARKLKGVKRDKGHEGYPLSHQ